MSFFRALLLLALLPTQSLALSRAWIPETFGDYIDSLDALGRPYKIVYGHFAAVEPLTVEDTTAARSADFIAHGYHSKQISAPAVFALVDPRHPPRRHGQLQVLLTRYWDNAPDLQGESPARDGYKHINFMDITDPAHGDRILFFSPDAQGTLTENGWNFIFTGPFTPVQARELMHCVFDGACGAADIPHLRALPY